MLTTYWTNSLFLVNDKCAWNIECAFEPKNESDARHKVLNIYNYTFNDQLSFWAVFSLKSSFLFKFCGIKTIKVWKIWCFDILLNENFSKQSFSFVHIKMCDVIERKMSAANNESKIKKVSSETSSTKNPKSIKIKTNFVLIFC